MAEHKPAKPKREEPALPGTGTGAVRVEVTGETHPVPRLPEETQFVRLYRVEEGETLASIAEKFYDDASQWTRILDANRDRLLDHDRVETGTELRIPIE